MWGNILKWFLHPLTLICILLVIISSYAVISNYNHTVDDLNKNIAQQEEVIRSQQNSLDIYQKDTVLIEKFNSSKQSRYIKEQELQKELDAIPNTSTNRPFTNPELLAAAKLLRNFQHSDLSANPSSPSSR